MIEREKELRAKIESLEAETGRLLRFETALLQVRNIVAASLPPNHGIAPRAVVADIVGILEENGFPLSAHQMAAADEMPASPEGNHHPLSPNAAVGAGRLNP